MMRAAAGGLPAAILLMGPTASGKTVLALEIAARYPVEIISVDSAQVYRGMDVGTAKPSAAERAAVPHHLIDVIDPDQSYSAAQFRNDATRLMREITARGRVPLLAGGTMLYFKALREGLSKLPQADAALRAAIEAEAREKGWPAMHAELAHIDATTAARLNPGDAQRIQRALEVFRITGKPLSVLQGARVARARRSTVSCRWRWFPQSARLCTGASNCVSKPCWPRAWWRNSRPCAGNMRCTPVCRRCAVSATARHGSISKALTILPRCATAASMPHASSPSANSPGCAR